MMQPLPKPWLRRAYVLAILLVTAARVAANWDTDPGQAYSRWSTTSDAGVYDRFGWNLAQKGIMGVGDRPSAFCLPAQRGLSGRKQIQTPRISD